MPKATLDFRGVRYFETVARLGSFSAASRELRIAQPALSRLIARIERAYQVKLFVRNAQGVSLTPLGETLLRRSRSLLKELSLTQAVLIEAGQQAFVPSNIQIALVSSLAETLTPSLISTLASSFPDARPHVRTLSALNCHELVDAGQIDFAITVPTRQYNEGEIVARVPLCLVHKPGMFPQFGAERVDFVDLASITLVLPPTDNGLRELVDAVAAEAGVRLHRIIDVDGIGSRKEAAISGLGGTVMATLNVRREIAHGALVAKEIEHPQLLQSFVFRQRAGLDRRFAGAIRSLCGDILKRALGAPKGA